MCMGCPNCGECLVTERIATQMAGTRAVRLHWVICTNCRHVALAEWHFVDDGLDGSVEAGHRSKTGQG
jgi:hypothetical protein